MLMLRWINEKGIASIDAMNRRKAEMLYTEVDRNPLFYCPVAPNSRSLMNVIFRGKDEQTEKAFSAFCKSKNIEGVDGHRSVGGFRASLYNAVSEGDVAALVTVMQAFESLFPALS